MDERKMIYLDDAIDALRKCQVIDVKNMLIEKDEAMKNLIALPSAQPQRTGRWIDGKCNRCGTHAPYWAMASTYYLSEYCPNCGAKMEAQE